MKKHVQLASAEKTLPSVKIHLLHKASSWPSAGFDYKITNLKCDIFDVL